MLGEGRGCLKFARKEEGGGKRDLYIAGEFILRTSSVGV